ncbi:MAG: PolC-type DNA polymerase III, partial [Christensenellales bacterium]
MREHKGKSLVDYINDYTVIDIETTGLSPVYDEIIELAAIRVRDGIIADTFSALVRPICQLDSFIVQLTGITNDMLKTAPRIHKVLLKYIEFLGDDILVGHNIHFDINFIYDNCISELGQPLPNDFIDILRVSRILLKSLENHKLNTIAQELSIDCSQAHRALGDCIITYKCYELLKNIMREGDYYRRLALQIIE